jgi:stage II sporulation protein D
VFTPEELRAGDSEPIIRVALLSEAPAVTFGVSGVYEVVNSATGGLIAVAGNGDAWEVSSGEDVLRVTRNGEAVGSFGGPIIVRQKEHAITFQGTGQVRAERSVAQGISVIAAGDQVSTLPRDTESITVADAQGVRTIAVATEHNVLSVQVGGESRNYRGNLEIIGQGETLLAINELKIEEYLYGVVPAEMPHTWPQAALQAQAVAARTFALRQIQNSPANSPYHLCDTQASQVYRGLNHERPESSQAVDATRGQVIFHQGRPIGAFYHSCSGGRTENSEDVWQMPLSYIRGGDDPYDSYPRHDPSRGGAVGDRADLFDIDHPHYNWEVNYTADQLADQLADKGYPFSSVTDIEVLEMTASGVRVQRLQVRGTGLDLRPHTEEIKNADRVRVALGLKSAFFELTKEMDPMTGDLARVSLAGHGWGHGLGMSQHGARGMARKGFDHTQIIHHYYTGVLLEPNYGR